MKKVQIEMIRWKKEEDNSEIMNDRFQCLQIRTQLPEIDFNPNGQKSWIKLIYLQNILLNC